MADLSAATDLLVRHLKRDSHPGRGSTADPGRSADAVLVVLWGRGETWTVLTACRDMFRFDRAHT